MDDPAYKRLLTHRRVVKDLLIGFIAPQRGLEWAGALYFDTLREGPTENVTDELRRRLGDVVWSIDRRDGRGGVQTLHVVIEHQSSVDYSMPLRFLNYTSLLYQRLYHDRIKWRKSDTADAVLHVVVYNGDSRWDAPVTLAGLVERTEQDGAAHLALSYEVLDLVAVRRDDLPRSNLLRWVAELEQSVQAGALPERVRELGEWLAEAGEPGLTRTFDLWLAALGRKWAWSCHRSANTRRQAQCWQKRLIAGERKSWSRVSSGVSSRASNGRRRCCAAWQSGGSAQRRRSGWRRCLRK